MILIMTQSTHLKVFLDNATDEEKQKTLEILTTKFCAEDATLKHSYAVKKGFQSAIRSLYIEDKQLLPVGFLAYLEYYLKQSNVEYEVRDLRTYAPVHKATAKAILSDNYSTANGFKPRDYQRDAIAACIKHKSGGLSSPTGSGKSLIAFLITQIYKSSRILMLFDAIELVHQTRKMFIDYGMDESEIGVIQGKNIEDDKRVTLLSGASYENAFHIFPEINVIIIDEAHSSGSGLGSEMSTRVLYACQNAANRFGLSATYDKIDNKIRQLALYGNIGAIIYERHIQDQVSEGVLADITVNMYEVKEPEIRVVGSYSDVYEKVKIKTAEHKKELIAQGYEIVVEKSKEVARKFLHDGDETLSYVLNENRNKLIARLAKKYEHVLVLFTRKEHGRLLKQLLPEAYLIDGDSDAKTREAAKKHLKESKEHIVLASTIWGEGVDIPWVHCLILAGGGKGTIPIIQKFGRATRKDKDTKKQNALVIDFYDTFNPMVIAQSKRRKAIYENELKFKVEIFNA